MPEPTVERILVDLRGNRLLLDLDRPLDGPDLTAAIIDIGALGRLLGIEVAGTYLAVSDPVNGSELHVRSVHATAQVSPGGHRLHLPRRGSGWEISFPSGNQCWRRTDENGTVRTLCSELTGF